MSHLNDVEMSYFRHLLLAWRLAFILFVHGLFPNIWKSKASDEICKNDKKTRKYFLDKMYGIDESNLNQEIKKWEFPWIDRNAKL